MRRQTGPNELFAADVNADAMIEVRKHRNKCGRSFCLASLLRVPDLGAERLVLTW
jgi:hypothetical protein